jgi:hypothetical protein
MIDTLPSRNPLSVHSDIVACVHVAIEPGEFSPLTEQIRKNMRLCGRD